MINTALIQEQIDSANRNSQHFRKNAMTSEADKYQRLADDWQAILSAVEQQGKQEPVVELREEVDDAGSHEYFECFTHIPVGTKLYASPVQPAAEKLDK